MSTSSAIWPHTPEGTVLAVSVLTTVEELEGIREDWDRLWRSCPFRTPFQRPEWVTIWCRHFECRSIWAPVVRNGDRLIAIAPWLIYENESHRLVVFLAGGVSDYHDVLVEPNSAALAWDAIWRCLLRHRHLWDACDFEQLAPWSALRRAPAPSPFRETLSEGPPCPQLEVPASPASLSAAVPKGQWARFCKYRRRAERQGHLALEHASGAAMAPAWMDVFRLHRARWEHRGLAGALSDERLQRFHTAVALELAHLCAGVDRVTLAGRTIAGLYAFVVERVKYCYLQGIDDAHAHISPGLLLVGLVLENAQRSGIERVDFLRGDEPYKLAWGAKCTSNARRRLWLEA